MEITHNQEELQGRVSIKIAKDDYLPKVNEQLKNLRKKVNMRGFRPGHVPLNLVKKLYGKEVLVDEVYKLVNQGLIDFIKENKLKLVGDFIPVEEETTFNPNNEEDYQFVYDYAVTSSPLINYEQITVPFYKVKIDDQIINDEIDRIQKTYGQYKESEEIKDKDDIFYVTFVELDEEGNPKENGFKKDNIVLALDLINEKYKDQFVGKKVNDEITINLKEFVKEGAQVHQMLGVKPEDLENVGDNFKVVITTIKRFEPAELGEELYKKYAPNKEIKTEEEFREEVKKHLEDYFENEAKNLFKKHVKDILMDSVEVQIPEDFLLRWLKYRQENKPEDQKQTEEQLKEQLPSLVKAVKWNRILEQIAEDLGIKLEREDSVRVHAEYMKSLYAQYGIDPNMLGEDFFMQQAEGEYDKLDENQRYSIDSYAFENKVLDALIEKVNLDEREVTEDMFKTLLTEDTSKKEEANEEKDENKEQQEDSKADNQQQEAKNEETNEQTEEKTEDKE